MKNGIDEGATAAQNRSVRLFFALVPDDLCRDAIQDVLRTNQTAMRRCGKVTDRDNLHLTLRFLGDRPSSQIKELETAMAIVAAGQAPFIFSLDHFGLFGHEQSGLGRTARKQVLWLGSRQDDHIKQLAVSLDQVLVRHHLLDPALIWKIWPDQRSDHLPFRAHLTLTRQVPRDESDSLLQQLQTFPPIAFNAAFISLMQSVRVQDTLRYLPVCRIPLTGR